ncbi:hypothetical protein L1887_57938 [Cichorium endivia]|nr:hypothetical protein L1887_57938 [Cichorium endivia]
MAAPRTPSAAPPPIHLHSRVKVSNLGHGEVLFVGQTSFAAGVWVGIALDHPNGKNNGSVQGKRYFECDDGYGVFVRSSQVHVLSPEEEMHSVDDEPVPAPAPAPRAARPSAAATPSSAAAARLSPRKNPAATPARPAASRSSLAPGATPASAVRRTSAVSTASASSSASSSRPPTAAGAAARLGSPVKSTTGVRSPVKPAGIDPRSGRSSISSTSVRSTTTSALASRTGSPSTPAAAAARTVRPSIGASSAATPAAKTAAGLTRTTATARTPAASTSSAAAKPQTPSAARAGLRPVPASRPSMLSAGARTATSSPSVTSAARIAAARSATASAPISRTASAAGTASRTGSALGPSRLGPRSSAGSAVSSGRTSASQRLLDEEDAVLYNDDLEDGDANLLVSDPLLVGEDLHASHDDDIGADEADQTISAATAPDITLKSTKLLNKSTRDFMSLVEPSASSSALRSSAEFGALQKELEELRAKVRVLEKKRDDERSQIAELERTREEAERSIAAVPKLTAKVQDLQAELKDQRKLEKDWSMQKDDFERQLARLNDELESLTLDREMAEEKAETAALEAQEHLLSLETANAKIAAMEKDLNPHLLRRRTESGEPGAEGAEDDAEEEAEYSAAAELVQRENDQLRRVLRDLRDRSNEIEGEQRRKIIELERENAELIELNSTNDSLLPELENAESMIEDLKLQLDDALGAQDLVEQLTERNLQLSDVVKKLRDEIVEHETIAEINNELEEQHTINEKELREEVDLCESRIRDLAARNEALENNAVDYQNTFGQFRELVSNLQAELEAAKAEQAEYGGAEGSGRKQMADQAMLNLNLKLQSSALKSQAKTIDLELGRLQAAQASSHLEMIAAVLRLAPPEVFLRGGRMYRENMAIERKVDAFIGALRREELKEHECGLEFGRFVKQFEDFTMALGGDENDSDLAAKEVGSANLIDHDLDTLIAALGYAKQQLAQLYADDDDVEWELAGRNIEDDLFDPLQELITRIRNTKVLTRKVLRRLLSLADNDEAVRMEAIMHLPPLGRVTSQLVTFATLLCKTVAAYVGEVRTAKVAFDMTRVLDMVGAATEEGLGKRDVNLWSGPLESTSQLASTMQTVLGAIVEQENVMRISGPGPWLSRAEEIKTLAAQNPELERQVGKLGEDARDLLRQVKARDQALQEGAIKIERLQKQLERARAQVDEQSDVRTTLGEVQRQASAYQEANDALQTEIEALQKDHDALKLQVATATEAAGATAVEGERERGAGVPARVEGAEAAAYTSLETSYLVGQLEALKDACTSSPTQAFAQTRCSRGGSQGGRAGAAYAAAHGGAQASARAEASQVYSSALSALALSTVVDLTPLTRRVEGEEKRTRAWVPHDKQPRVQLEQHALTRARLVKQLAAASHRLSPHAVAT